MSLSPALLLMSNLSSPMTTYFIADLHLNQQQPEVVAGFMRFLRDDVANAEALYILGDFFDVWLGDDDPEPLHQQIAEALNVLHQKGIACYFIHGNRDFLLGQQFAHKAGMKLLPQEQVIELYDQRIVIMHGDTLCTDDKSYQRFRRITHNSLLQKIFLALPLSFRKRLGGYLRNESQQANKQKPVMVMDVNQQVVENTLRAYRSQLLIHGHTHQPAIHHFRLDGKPAQRVVLGDWHHTATVVRLASGQAPDLVAFNLS